MGDVERSLLEPASKWPARLARKLRQVRLDRASQFTAFCLILATSWRRTLFCYLPAFYQALALVNVQNYYGHYGAAPEDGYADSVSYYGRLYNLPAFNDGYDQERHLCPQSHRRTIPALKRAYDPELSRT